jgi:hypothetical protein
MKHTKTNNKNWNNINHLKYATFWVREGMCLLIQFLKKMDNFIQINQNGIAIYSQKSATKPPIAN